ncbi:MAG: UDP-N-acetylmuramate dehydrogenase [Phycisphaerae bacterium]
MSLFAGLDEICRPDVPLCEHTRFGLGGPARWFLQPSDEEQLRRIVHRCCEAEVPMRVLGGGANLLVRDEGFDGAVIKLGGAAYGAVRFDGERVWAGAAAPMSRLVRQSVRRGLSGLECLAGIPGTVGGGIKTNAGGRFGQIGTSVQRVRVMEPTGQIYEQRQEELVFGYRSSNIAERFILGAELGLVEASPAEVLQRFREIWIFKRNSQPLMQRNAGCIFKNPPGVAAGALIDQAGLKGRRIGGALVSRRHANFIIVEPGGKAGDVLELIELIRERVYARFGIELELEIEIW